MTVPAGQRLPEMVVYLQPADPNFTFTPRGSGELATMEVPPGGAASQAFDRRVQQGAVEILREQDDEPFAYVWLVRSPLVRVARAAGERVTFAPLTPGKYRVTTWHPLLPGSSEVVEVAPGRLSKLTLTVGVNSLPKPSR